MGTTLMSSRMLSDKRRQMGSVRPIAWLVTMSQQKDSDRVHRRAVIG